MFWWFGCSRPIEAAEEEWLLRRLNWLLARFGREVFPDGEPVIPDAGELGVSTDGSPEAVSHLFSLVCRRFQLDEGHLSLKLFDAERRRETEFDPFTGSFSFRTQFNLGLYRDQWQQQILIDRSQCRDLVQLGSTLAHELAHAKLHRCTDVKREWDDYERLVDLTTVFFGFGLFTAMAAESDFVWGDDVEKVPTRFSGYLSQAVVGHALAVGAWINGDLRPAWASWLNRHARKHVKRSLRYLRGGKGGNLQLNARGRLEMVPVAGTLTGKDPLSLRRQLEAAVAREDYEEAARIQKFLDHPGRD